MSRVGKLYELAVPDHALREADKALAHPVPRSLTGWYVVRVVQDDGPEVKFEWMGIRYTHWTSHLPQVTFCVPKSSVASLTRKFLDDPWTAQEKWQALKTQVWWRTGAPVVGMVDTLDSKPSDPSDRAGSSPAGGTFNYQNLLTKYMRHIREVEGVSLLDSHNYAGPAFTAEERAELERIDQEIG